MSYGRAFDFSRSFTEQFGELMREVPKVGISSIGSEGCDYAQVANSRNCYLAFV